MKHREESYRLAEYRPGDKRIPQPLKNVIVSTSPDVLYWFLFVSFLVGRGAHEWAISHGITPCPPEKMTTSKFGLQNILQTFSNRFSPPWKCFQCHIGNCCIGLCRQTELNLFFYAQSSACLRTGGTSERWSWQRKWNQDIIRLKKDDNQVKLWVLSNRTTIIRCQMSATDTSLDITVHFAVTKEKVKPA